MFIGQTAKIANTDSSVHFKGFTATGGVNQPKFEFIKNGKTLSDDGVLEYSLTYEDTDFKSHVRNVVIKKYTDNDLRRQNIYRNLDPQSRIQL